MFWQILRLEGNTIFRRRLFWIGLLGALLPSVLTLTLLFAFKTKDVPLPFFIWPGGIVGALSLINMVLGPLYYATGLASGAGYGLYLIVAITGVIPGQDYSWRTVQLWLSRGVARSHLLLARFLQLILATLVITLIFLLVGVVLAGIFTFLSQGSFNFGSLSIAQLFLSYLRTAYGSFPYLALTLLITVLSRSMVVSIAGMTLFMAGIEPLLIGVFAPQGEVSARIVEFLPTALAANLSQENITLAQMPVKHTAVQPSLLLTVIVIAVYTLVPLGITLWFFQHQDMTN